MKKFLLKTLISFSLIYIFLVFFIYSNQRSLMYFPPSEIISDSAAREILDGIDSIEVVTEDGVTLKAYMKPPSNDSKPIILFFHGNGSLALHSVNQFRPLLAEGYGILFAEYRGYGGNAGRPSEEGLYADAAAYIEYLNTKYPKKRTILYGQSLGSAVAVDIASKNPDRFSQLILEVPFDSALRVADKTYPFIPLKEILMRDKFESDKKIQNILIPKLFLIAGQDYVVGTDSGHRLYDLAHHPKFIHFYPEAEHHTIFSFDAISDISRFLATHK